MLVELKKETPITLSLLKQCVHVKRRVRKLHSKGSSSRIPNEEAVVGINFVPENEFGTFDIDTAVWKSCTKTGEPLLVI